MTWRGVARGGVTRRERCGASGAARAARRERRGWQSVAQCGVARHGVVWRGPPPSDNPPPSPPHRLSCCLPPPRPRLSAPSSQYTRNHTFARHTTLPLLEGVNAWSICYLHRNQTANGTAFLEDWNPYAPDEVAENNPERNPITGLSLMRRAATAHRDIAMALGVAYPPYLDQIIEQLIPPPSMPGPDGEPVWIVADGVSWQQPPHTWDLGLAVYPIFPSETVGDGAALDDATARVALASTALYTNLTCAPLYPDPAVESCVNAGEDTITLFTAAARALAAAPSPPPAPVTEESPNATEGAGSADGIATGAAGAAGAAGATGAPSALTARALADALERHVGAWGANASNLLAYCPGGGVETASLPQAVNDMLVQVDGAGHIVLFPAWPPDEPASFTTLRTKGAFLVSASWDATARVAVDVTIASVGGSTSCGLVVGLRRAAIVRCSGETTARATTQRLCSDSTGRVRWRVETGAVCEVSLGAEC